MVVENDRGALVCRVRVTPRIMPGVVALPEGAWNALHLDGLQAVVLKYVPFAGLGLGWICPALLGLVIGLIFRAVRRKHT